MNNNEILVSILCLTYNQKDYIKQCLDGFVMQKTNFRFEVLIHDDASTDGTKEIIQEYVNKYPDIIKPFYEEENQYSKDNIITVIKELYGRCSGKYIAQCEGDDYWTDENKLQKQVDFMEANLDCSLCFHPTKIIYEGFDFEKLENTYPTKKMLKKGLNIEHLLKENFIQTNSVMYRFNFSYLENKLKDDIMPCDWYLHLLHAKLGKIGYLPQVMSVYRRNPNGIWSDDIKTSKEKRTLKFGIKELNFYYNVYKNITDYSNRYFEDYFLPYLRHVAFIYLKYEKKEELRKLYNLYSKEILQLLETVPNASINNKYKKYKKLFNITLTVLIIFVLMLILFLIKLYFLQ